MTDTAAPPRWAEYMPVADLAPALKNAKAHDLEALAASFDAFGALEPVVLDERTGRLVAGHGRIEFLTAREATGADMPEGVWVDKRGRWCWLVTRGFTSRDDDHAHAAGIALNRVGERGGWHELELVPLLDDLRATPELFDAVGFTAADLDLLIAQTQAPGSPTDPAAEWVGMPEFEQRDLQPKFSTTVHFLSKEDAARFWTEVLGHTGNPSRTAWWPASDGHLGCDWRSEYVAVEDADGPAVPGLPAVEE